MDIKETSVFSTFMKQKYWIFVLGLIFLSFMQQCSSSRTSNMKNIALQTQVNSAKVEIDSLNIAVKTLCIEIKNQNAKQSDMETTLTQEFTLINTLTQSQNVQSGKSFNSLLYILSEKEKSVNNEKK